MMSQKISHLLLVIASLALIIPVLNCAQKPLSDLELQLEKAPRLNEPITLTCIRQTSDFVSPEQENEVNGNISQGNGDLVPPIHEKITLEFERVDLKTRWLIKVPAQEVLAGGSLNWEGDMTGEPMDFSTTIKFPYEGNWAIYASSAQPPHDKDHIFLNVGEESSSFGWVENYAGIVDPFPDVVTEKWPITVYFDMAEPPLLNEPFQITWSISTIRDITEATGGIGLIRMEGTKEINIPVEDMLIDGNVAWQGSLEKGSPLHFTATVKMPVEGDLSIGAWCKSYVDLQPVFATYSLPIHVSKDKSIWGWTEPHESKPQGPLPPPPSLPQVR
jgi:hypothetical protein